MEKYESYGYAILMSIIVACTMFLLANSYVVMNKPQAPRLVGIGCMGARPGAVLYANEEDDFPICDQIIANERRSLGR